MEIEGRSITAYFAHRSDAEEATERLRHAGLAETQLDPIAAMEADPAATAWMVVTLTDGSDVQVERATKILKQYGGEV